MYAFSLILQKVYLVWKIAVKALVVFSPIFVADAKIIFCYEFVALLKKVFLEISNNPQENACAGVSFLTKFIK